MKPIKNIGNNLEVPYEFYTYSFPKNRVVMVENNLFEFIKDRWPLSFDFSIALDEKVKRPPEVHKDKTPMLIKTEDKSRDMRFSYGQPKATFGPDELPASGVTDGDGVSWFGEGVEVEGGKV